MAVAPMCARLQFGRRAPSVRHATVSKDHALAPALRLPQISANAYRGRMAWPSSTSIRVL